MKTMHRIFPTPLDDRPGGRIDHAPVLYRSGVLPEDFPKRLVALKEASGLSWNGLAEAIGVDVKQLRRWRKGAEPCGGAMLSLVDLALTIPGGIQVLLGYSPAGGERRRMV